MPNIIMADSKTGLPQWETLTPTPGRTFQQTINSAHIVPPNNCIIFLRRDSELEFTSGTVVLGYMITVFSGAVNGSNFYRYKIASEEDPVVANETPFFDGQNNNGGNWKIDDDGALYRSSGDSGMQAGESIKYLIVEIPNPDSFLPGVTA